MLQLSEVEWLLCTTPTDCLFQCLPANSNNDLVKYELAPEKETWEPRRRSFQREGQWIVLPRAPYLFYFSCLTFSFRVEIGTPLPPLEKAKDSGEFVPLWKQDVRAIVSPLNVLTIWTNHVLKVRDEQGRRRLHGAFTGGFSAGYYNTVGSKEGEILPLKTVFSLTVSR